jgi:hypothetical protein
VARYLILFQQVLTAYVLALQQVSGCLLHFRPTDEPILVPLGSECLWNAPLHFKSADHTCHGFFSQ